MAPPYAILYYGTPQFAVPALEALIAAPHLFSVKAVVTQPDRPAGRGGKIAPSPGKEVALKHQIPILQPESVKKALPDFLAAAGAYGPFDAAVVAAFGQILPVEALSMPARGSINIHASLLPRWRGAAPIHRAIMEGDAETGVALMNMEAGLDTGAVYSVSKIPITADDTTGVLFEKLAARGASLLVSDLPKIIEGSLRSEPQPADGITIAKKITNDEARIDWSRPAAVIDRHVRALNPFPGAFTFLAGARVKLFRTVPKPGNAGAPPGTVTLLDPRRLEVATGEGSISIEEAQIEGRKRLPIEAFLRGTPVSRSSVFG